MLDLDHSRLAPTGSGAPSLTVPRSVDGIITPHYAVVPAKPEHLGELARTMREKDRLEIERLGYDVKKALWRAYRNSILCKTAIVDAKVAAIWGLAIAMSPERSPLSSLGTPWLHTSAAIEAIPCTFVRHARHEVRAMRRLMPKLESYVDASYVHAVRFIKLLGFAVDEAKPVGKDGAMFCRFHIGFEG